MHMARTDEVARDDLVALAADINAAHREVRDALQHGAEHARHAGELLAVAKARLPHGEWLPWLKENCEVSPRAAQGYMQIAREWTRLQDAADEPNARRVAHLPQRQVLALLANTREPGEVDAPPEASPTPVAWRWLPVSDLALPAWSFHHVDPALDEKLRASLQLHGQVAAVVVRETGTGHEVVDGRRRVEMLRALGREHVMAVNAGPISEDEAVRLALSLQLNMETSYADVAHQVCQLSAHAQDPAAFPAQLAATVPFTAERIGYFRELMVFDWSKFDGAGDEKAAMPVAEPDTWTQPDYRCPSCQHEWSGTPRPFHAGGAAMVDARERRRGQKAARLVYTADEHREFSRLTRDLADALGTTDIADTLREVVRRAHAEWVVPALRKAG
jgi:hypothetical protein